MEPRPSATTLNLRRSHSKFETDQLRTSRQLEAAKAELERVKAEAAAAQRANEQLQINFEKSRRDTKVRLRVIAVVMLTAALIKITWQSVHSSSAPIKIAVSLPAESGTATGDATANVDTSDSPGTRELSRSLDRLRDAFHSFPEESQSDVVREINQKHPGAALACPLVWNNAGVPSLLVGDKTGNAPPSMIVALNQCASEVEKLRAEKGPLH